MKRERSNFQSCKIIESYWRINGDITPGFISGQEKKFIEETLELKLRDKFALQDVRDFAVIYFTSISKEHTNILHDKMWDCMSAVTATIDGYQIGNIKNEFGLMFGDECAVIITKYKNGSDEALDGDEVDKLVEHIRNTINLHEGNITNAEYDELELGVSKPKIKSYSYSFEDGTDDDCKPCKIMTVYIHFEDGTEKSICDITMGVDCESDKAHIAEICEETVENYGYEFLESDSNKDEGEA